MNENPLPDANLYKEIGNIQGTLNSLVVNVNQGFGRFQKDISELKNEVNGAITNITGRLDKLEVFKANLEGGKQEAQKIALLAGSFAGVVGSAIVWFLSNIHLFIK